MSVHTSFKSLNFRFVRGISRGGTSRCKICSYIIQITQCPFIHRSNHSILDSFEGFRVEEHRDAKSSFAGSGAKNKLLYESTSRTVTVGCAVLISIGVGRSAAAHAGLNLGRIVNAVVCTTGGTKRSHFRHNVHPATYTRLYLVITNANFCNRKHDGGHRNDIVGATYTHLSLTTTNPHSQCNTYTAHAFSARDGRITCIAVSTK